jgi:ABC-type sugar transport system permease subunit
MLQHKKKIFDKKLLFYCCGLALPILQYCVFYIYVNFNSFILAFTNYDFYTQETTFAGFSKFQEVFYTFFESQQSTQLMLSFRNSLITYALNLIVGTGGALIFSYYIYKQRSFSGLYKVILFLPSVIPGVALISMYKTSMSSWILEIYNMIAINDSPVSLLDRTDTAFFTVLLFSLFFGFGTQVLMYLGAMNKINPSISEAAKLDGVSFLRELWSITIPCIYSTLATFIVVGIAGIFTSDLGLYSFFSTNAPGPTHTLGYYLYRETQIYATNQSRWAYIAAVGLCFTAIVAPITLGLRATLNKLDPME